MDRDHRFMFDGVPKTSGFRTPLFAEDIPLFVGFLSPRFRRVSEQGLSFETQVPLRGERLAPRCLFIEVDP